jgi:hypothetical protein
MKTKRPLKPLYATYRVDIFERKLHVQVGDQHHELHIDSISEKLKACSTDGLLDHYPIGGGCGIRWAAVNEDVHFRRLLRKKK